MLLMPLSRAYTRLGKNTIGRITHFRFEKTWFLHRTITQGKGGVRVHCNTSTDNPLDFISLVFELPGLLYGRDMFKHFIR